MLPNEGIKEIFCKNVRSASRLYRDDWLLNQEGAAKWLVNPLTVNDYNAVAFTREILVSMAFGHVFDVLKYPGRLAVSVLLKKES